MVNLLTPRSRSAGPASKFWNDAFTFVMLRYEFLSHRNNGAPLSIGRTFMTFYDFDVGRYQGCLLYTSPSPRDS